MTSNTKLTLIALAAALATPAVATALPKTLLRAKLCQDTKACIEGRVPGCPETDAEADYLEEWFEENCPEFSIEPPDEEAAATTPTKFGMTLNWSSATTFSAKK